MRELSDVPARRDSIREPPVPKAARPRGSRTRLMDLDERENVLFNIERFINSRWFEKGPECIMK